MAAETQHGDYYYHRDLCNLKQFVILLLFLQLLLLLKLIAKPETICNLAAIFATIVVAETYC